MHHWRISKYDDAKRDARGSYIEETWTSIHDIGKHFTGEQLTAAEYYRVEQNYIGAALAFYSESASPTLRAVDVELGRRSPELEEETSIPPFLREHQAILIESLPDVLRACLRESMWCRIESDSGQFGIEFGYDYYMYVHSGQPCTRAIARAKELGLFVEPRTSSYTAASGGPDG